MTESFRVRAADPDQDLEELWPPFGLRIVSPRLMLRVLREADFPQYVAAATAGVCRTERNPFSYAWNEKTPAGLVRNSLPFIWSTRASIGPEDWHLPLGVFLREEGAEGGTLIGMQDCFARDWTVLRRISSGSWLRTDQQGRGYGTEMRAAMLLWAFDYFGAEHAESAAYDWNVPSHRVSEALGYRVTGTRRVVDAHGEEPGVEQMFALTHEDFLRPDWSVQVTGSDRLTSFSSY
ncbi:GNAT family N-acetyltransferase [Nesterenkonia flava]|uniref:GNAT family protein n=1 Tax=Nesterenkonia flava TaxID=469799 RepID=A0ABU1FVW1_9MICC|nr:GNAT family protein [Nesterenkonia flava]MDR5712286.1 GNAT family protein [Nesterenkonia flava]